VTVSAEAVDWLLGAEEPAIRYRARTWLLGRAESDPEVRSDRAAIPDGQIVSTLVDFPEPGQNPYRKWSGLHWRLVSLADFELPVDRAEVRATLDAGLDRELDWIADPKRLDAIPRVHGLYRPDASMEGNALYAASTFGHAGDERAQRLVDRLLEWQWPDGGWNCDRASSGYRSSFHESWPTALGLAAYHRATGDADALTAARRTAELLLEHRLFRSLATGKPIHASFAALHWPAYWHYDVLAGLRVLHATGPMADPRATDALERLRSKQRPDGRFETRATWWRSSPGASAPPDIVDWGKGRPCEVLTLQALRVLKAAGSRPAGGRTALDPGAPTGRRSALAVARPCGIQG
jgi:hypothetical protein